jgi:hypothetical protein
MECVQNESKIKLLYVKSNLAWTPQANVPQTRVTVTQHYLRAALLVCRWWVRPWAESTPPCKHVTRNQVIHIAS